MTCLFVLNELHRDHLLEFLQELTELDLDMMEDHEELERINAWKQGRRLVFVVHQLHRVESPSYQRRLEEAVNGDPPE